MLKDQFEQAFEKWELREGRRVNKNAAVYNLFKTDLLNSVSAIVRSMEYADKIVETGVGQGFWVQNPWIIIRDAKVSSGPQHGVYVVYLFSPNSGCLYLTINQGAEHKSISELSETAIELRSQIEKPENFSIGLSGDILGTSPDSDTRPTPRARKWTEGTVYSLKYSRNQLSCEGYNLSCQASL